MGENKSSGFRAEFNRAIEVEFSDKRITSYAGVVLLRNMDHKLSMCDLIADQLDNPRRTDRVRY